MTERSFGQLAAQRLDGGLMRDLPQRHHSLQIRQRAEPGLQEGAAVPHLLGSRLVLRLHAPDRVDDDLAVQFQPVVRALLNRAGPTDDPTQRVSQTTAGPRAGEWAAGPVRAPGTTGK